MIGSPVSKGMSVTTGAEPFSLSRHSVVEDDLKPPNILDTLVAVGAAYLHVTSHRNCPCLIAAFSYSVLHEGEQSVAGCPEVLDIRGSPLISSSQY